MQKATLWLTCLLLSILLTACGHGWIHKQVPEAKWDADYTDCVYQAESRAQNSRLAKDPVKSSGAFGEVRYLTDKCMEMKGYFQAAD